MCVLQSIISLVVCCIFSSYIRTIRNSMSPPLTILPLGRRMHSEACSLCGSKSSTYLLQRSEQNCIHTCTPVHHTHIYSTHTRVCVWHRCTYTCTHTHVHIHIYTHTRVRTYTHMYTHTYTHARAHALDIHKMYTHAM